MKKLLFIPFVLLVFPLLFVVDLGAYSCLGVILLRSLVLVSDVCHASFLIPIWVQGALSRPRSSARTRPDFPSSRVDSGADAPACFPGSFFGSTAVSRSWFFSVHGAVARSVSILDLTRPPKFFFGHHFLCDLPILVFSVLSVWVRQKPCPSVVSVPTPVSALFSLSAVIPRPARRARRQQSLAAPLCRSSFFCSLGQGRRLVSVVSWCWVLAVVSCFWWSRVFPSLSGWASPVSLSVDLVRHHSRCHLECRGAPSGHRPEFVFVSQQVCFFASSGQALWSVGLRSQPPVWLLAVGSKDLHMVVLYWLVFLLWFYFSNSVFRTNSFSIAMRSYQVRREARRVDFGT
jgi:hypothetical protein